MRILFVCHGNICRSTMAQFVMEDLVKKAGLSGEVTVDSAATSREEIGNDVHHGTRDKLRREGVPCGHHRARQMTRADYDAFDLLIGMDAANVSNMRRIAGGDPQGKIAPLLSFANVHRDIADPWYTGNFDATYVDVLTGCRALLGQISPDAKA